MNSIKIRKQLMSLALALTCTLTLDAGAAATKESQRTGAEVVDAICGNCHKAGTNGAPKIGDKKAWEPRLGQGLQALVESAKAGKNGMPPRGGSDADDMELARAIVFMIWPRMRL